MRLRTRRVRLAGLTALVAPGVLAARYAPAAATRLASCEKLSSLTLPNASIASAQPVDDAPRAYCRVSATLTPSADSDITIEVWMPASNWNQTFQAVGNG